GSGSSLRSESRGSDRVLPPRRALRDVDWPLELPLVSDGQRDGVRSPSAEPRRESVSRAERGRRALRTQQATAAAVAAWPGGARGPRQSSLDEVTERHVTRILPAERLPLSAAPDAPLDDGPS